jgi:predicted nucleotidyltransferase
MKPSQILAEKRDEVLAVIAASQFNNPRLFGSVGRGDDSDGSDLDILVDAPADVSLFDLVGLELQLIDLLGVRVDLFTLDTLKKDIRPNVLRDQRPL